MNNNCRPGAPCSSLLSFVAVVVSPVSGCRIKLQENDWKTSWRHYGHASMIKRLKEETLELEHAIVDGNAHCISEEAADIANFAMMISDNALRRAAAAEAESHSGHRPDTIPKGSE